ncbi:MAG: thiamine pyrophosphate-binding protein, partial [Firmicutes bacterium]|nr:thiamine pyrophosphate-binding protein [Bacillota bacterium]
MKINGGEIIVDYLVKERVPYVFTLCGHGNVGLLNALYDRKDEIKTISVRHEQAAGHMADAYFRVKHRPVATLTSCGPGSANLPIALASAMMDSSAFLAITGNVPTSQFNRGPFQETGRHFQGDFPSVVRSYVKKSFQPTRVEMVPLAIRQAYKTMLTGRTGPVNLDVPFNVFLEEADLEVPDPKDWREGIASRVAGDPEAVEKALGLLLSAERPLILAGHGASLSEAGPEVLALAEKLGIPVANTPNGAGIVDMRGEFSLGTVGRNGTYQAQQACRNCDVVLALGVKFCDRVSSAWIEGYTFNIPPTKLIHVDIDPDELGRNYPPHIGIWGDVKTVLKQFLAGVDGEIKYSSNTAPWWEEIRKWKQDWIETVQPRLNLNSSPIRPERVIGGMRKVLTDDAIIVSDVGVHHNWLFQLWPTYYPHTFLQSWGFASMGFGVCGVLGAKLAAPERKCVSVCGDGGFMMTPHILCTAVEYNIPAVWVVWNNYGYCGIRDIQLYSFNGRELASSFMK